jgi:hypothetical protein
MEQTFVCESCGASNDIFIDISGGAQQEFVQDCRVCCRPNVVKATFDGRTGKYRLEVYLEDRG